MKLLLSLIATAVMMASSFAADVKPAPAVQDVRPPVPNVSPADKAKNKMLLAKKKKDKKVKKDATKSPSKPAK